MLPGKTNRTSTAFRQIPGMNRVIGSCKARLTGEDNRSESRDAQVADTPRRLRGGPDRDASPQR